MMPSETEVQSQALAEELERFIDAAVESAGGDTAPVNPRHRVPFLWPPRPVSLNYHIPASSWDGRATLEAYGEPFEVRYAVTEHGVFAKVEHVWNEAKAADLDEALRLLRNSIEPYLRRQIAMGATLGLPGRFTGQVASLAPIDLLKLLYCEDRDVSHEASVEIEKRASSRLYGIPMVVILRDERHPLRRIAQWSVLDMFEDLPSFLIGPDEQRPAIAAMSDLVRNAKDDFARVCYKAGVVLGGHVCTHDAAIVLLDCMFCDSAVGRLSAIHGVFHLAEWMPELAGTIAKELDRAAETDNEPQLREFAACMARDVRSGAVDHVDEPVLLGNRP